MLDPKFLAGIEERFAALDFTDANARIAAMQTEAANCDAAVERAHTRITEIAKRAAEIRDGIRDGRAVADALLADADPSSAADLAPHLDRLEDERQALRLGIADLTTRAQRLRNQVIEVQQGCAQLVVLEAAPLVDALSERLRTIGQDVLDTFAALSAVLNTARAGGVERIEAETAALGMVGPGCALPFRTVCPEPKAITKALSGLAGAGVAVPYRPTDTAHLVQRSNVMVLQR